MSDHPENKQLAPTPEPNAATHALPDVQPPQAGFLVQLFLIPMVIVAAIICVWLLFNVISQSESPTELVRGLRKMDSSSWQKAYTLSNLLRTPNSQELKNDSELASELVLILESPLNVEVADPNLVKLRVFVCRCLGEFEIPEGMNALISAMKKTDTESEIEIGRSAVESLSILIQNLGPESQRENKELLAALIETSNIQAQNPGLQIKIDQLRSTIGFALGVLGGEEAMTRLQGMLSDSFPNARFNAAAGLARHGDLSGKNVLLEMLDAESESVVAGEAYKSSYDFKRSVVATTAIDAVSALSKHHETSELLELISAIKVAAESEAFGGKAKVLAKELLISIEKP